MVEGYKLLRSSSTASGYAGVYQLPTGKFKASACFDGKSTHIGHFDTAIEAAVAYAKHVAQNEEEGEWVDGYRLFRSTNSTGFMGVRELTNGRFEMRRRVDGRDVRIGGPYETALEAAVAYSRHAAQDASNQPSPPPPPSSSAAASSSSAAAEPASSSAAAADPASSSWEPKVKEACGYQLLLSSESPTGYLGVKKKSGGAHGGSHFEARGQVAGPHHSSSVIGKYKTVVEAAIAVAKHAAGELAPMVEDTTKHGGQPTTAEVTEAGGYQLWLSRDNSTGYKGVRPVMAMGVHLSLIHI